MLEQAITKKAEGDAALSYEIHKHDIVNKSSSYWAGYHSSLVYGMIRSNGFVSWIEYSAQHEQLYTNTFIEAWEKLAKQEAEARA